MYFCCLSFVSLYPISRAHRGSCQMSLLRTFYQYSVYTVHILHQWRCSVVDQLQFCIVFGANNERFVPRDEWRRLVYDVFGIKVLFVLLVSCILWLFVDYRYICWLITEYYFCIMFKSDTIAYIVYVSVSIIWTIMYSDEWWYCFIAIIIIVKRTELVAKQQFHSSCL